MQPHYFTAHGNHGRVYSGNMNAAILPLNKGSARQRKRRSRFLSLPFLFTLVFVLCAQFFLLPRYLFRPSAKELHLSRYQIRILDSGLEKCAQFNALTTQYTATDIAKRANPRWNAKSGQNETFVLTNVTLFDGDEVWSEPVNVTFSKGIITDVSSSKMARSVSHATVVDMGGKFVTPGLVDMHSHHLAMTWPALPATVDNNEISDAFGPLTPFVRSLDAIKPYDEATTLIRSGGVTSSLILPGSANIMGGEAFVVKNVLRAGKDGEESVAEMLLEFGVPKAQWRRYMKMACGENPRRVYKHTRMGNAWLFRKHMERAVELKARQEGWCLEAAVAREKGDAAKIAALTTSKDGKSGGLPEELELESSVAILRGKIGVNIHCYEPEDNEFGFRIQAFHHALSAWKVPELIKASGQNITIATFSDFGLYKQEAYGANLYAGKILAEHGVPVAYKSDHSGEITNAKYLLYQASMGHSFGLSEVKALQSVTSVPARSIQQDHRIGYVKPGYDADLVVWDSHPLSIGATPLQVYVDGKETLDPMKVKESMPSRHSDDYNEKADQPRIRPAADVKVKDEMCKLLNRRGSTIVVTGITKSFLAGSDSHASTRNNMTAVINNGKLECIGSFSTCVSVDAEFETFHLTNGHLLPGLTAISQSFGMKEIAAEDNTGDGDISRKVDVTNVDNVVYAKYGVHLEGRAFKRAQIGGVTQSVTTPTGGGFMGGVSVGIKIGENKTTLNGGIFQQDVGLHFLIGQRSKYSESTPSISVAISKLRHILRENADKDNVFGSAANGSIPLVVHANNKYDIMQMIKLKEDFASVHLVIYGGAEAPAVAVQLAAAGIPVIMTHNRGGPAYFENKDLLTGPPLTPSAASVMLAANARIGLALHVEEGDWAIHTLALEASWAAKYSGLSQRAAVDLVSRNIKDILRLGSTEHEDIVVWEGNPLEFGASVVAAIDGDNGRISSCWPISE